LNAESPGGSRWGLAESPNHHSSHRQLLGTDLVPPTDATLDAIVVPTARRPAQLRSAIALAAELDCVLLALCSKYSRAAEVDQLARRADIDYVAIDTDHLPPGLMPAFNTTELLRNTPFERRTDTSLKRNLGLLLANMFGWHRIVFLDDDIEIQRPEDLVDAVQQLGRYDAVGLAIEGFPDNSVVCHANRETGGFQDCFVGGGALAVGPASMRSFFPSIYNEDWFFLLDDVKLRPTAVVGSVKQSPYDPFAKDLRARDEELGDCLAEGIFWLLDNHRRVRDADAAYWRRFLATRRQFIREVIGRVAKPDLDPEQRRMSASLKAADGRCQIIEPEFCVRYLRAWRADRTRWRKHIDKLVSRGIHPAMVLTELGLGSVPFRLRSQPLDENVTPLLPGGGSVGDRAAHHTAVAPAKVAQAPVETGGVHVGDVDRERDPAVAC
jgi:hypothetical protein